MPCLTEGILIAIEGIDGAGKTTQCNLLRDWLNSQGFHAFVLKEPSDSEYGKKIRIRSQHHRISDFLGGPEIELKWFIEDRRENVRKRIKPKIDNNKIVIMDRYYFSTIAYQSVLGIDPENIKKINEEFAPPPDITIIIDITPKVGIKRINGRGDKCDSFEKQDYLEKVRLAFLEMKKYPNIFIIKGDEERTLLQVFQKIKELVEPIIKKKLDTKGELIVCE